MTISEREVEAALASWYGRGDWKSMFYPARSYYPQWDDERVAMAQDAMRRALEAAQRVGEEQEEMTEATTLSAERLAELEAEVNTVGDLSRQDALTLIARIRELEQILGNLICRINRDGGQTLTGDWKKDAEAAETVVVHERATAESALAAAREREARLREAAIAMLECDHERLTNSTAYNKRSVASIIEIHENLRAALTETGHDR